VYSSFCGGISENSGNLWRISHEYLQSQTEDFCINLENTPRWSHKNLNWEKSFTFREIENLFSISHITDITINKQNNTARVEEFKINELIISGQYEIRNKFDLPSSLFLIEIEDNRVLFIGNGYGHGVGMCQIGAIARAIQGQTFRDILQFYYPGTKINQ
jgi:stage II sporulation protein D